MNRWTILDAETNAAALAEPVAAPTAWAAVAAAIDSAGLDPTRGYVARRFGCDA